MASARARTDQALCRLWRKANQIDHQRMVIVGDGAGLDERVTPYSIRFPMAREMVN